MKCMRLAVTLAAAFVMAGCGDDDPSIPTTFTPTPTRTAVPMVPASATPPIGPQITFIGITRADDILVDPLEVSPEGVPVFARLAGATGGASGFRLVVEGKPGSSGAPIAISTFNDSISALPDLQIQSNRALGNGSTEVCDIAQRTPGPTPGGVPAIDPPSFDGSIANTINDLACRFRDGAGDPMGISSDVESCVSFEPEGDSHFVNVAETTVQFCGFVSGIVSFVPGDTLLTVRLRDQAGNVGVPAQMIIRVN